MFVVSLLLAGLALADPPAAPVDTSACAQTGKLQKKALLGKLEPDVEACLEARIADDDPMHAQDASELLIANAHGQGEKALWAARVERHLTGLDKTDAELAYQLAYWLVEQPGKETEALGWTEVALAHTYRFDEDMAGERLAGVYGVRARAMVQLWRTAETQALAAPDDPTKRMEAFAAQGRARLYAVEWMQQSQRAGRSTSDGFAVCVETGWTEQRCAEALESGTP